MRSTHSVRGMVPVLSAIEHGDEEAVFGNDLASKFW